MRVKDVLLSGETLFRNEEVFEPDYTPEQFSHRDAQLRDIAGCIKPAIKARALNALVYGKPATGKTTSIKVVFGQLRETTEKVIPVYVNCQINSSEYRVFSEIHKAVFGYPPPESGIPLSAVCGKIFTKLSREKKSLVVALDDMDFASEANKILYVILRAYESYPGARTGVIAVFSRNEIHKLEDKVRSIFNPVEIEFPSYAYEEILDILKSRAEAGLYPGVMPDSVMKKIARHAHESGDLRLGITLIKSLALKAESESSRKISESHFSLPAPGKRTLEKTEEEMLRILGSGKMDSGMLFREINKTAKTSYSGFYRMLARMEKKRLIEISDVVTTGRGRTRLIASRCP